MRNAYVRSIGEQASVVMARAVYMLNVDGQLYLRMQNNGSLPDQKHILPKLILLHQPSQVSCTNVVRGRIWISR